MASVLHTNASQATQVSVIELAAGETATINFKDPRMGSVGFDVGGVSWTINPTVDGTSISCKVEHSLLQDGDEARYWTPDRESPFKAGAEGNEHFRVQRVRFTAETGDVTVVVASNSKFEVATS